MWLAALLMLFVSLNLWGISIAEISFQADFAVSETELLRASGLSLGQDYQRELVEQAIASMQAYLSSIGEYYVRIPNPELIAIDEHSLELHFSLEAVVNSSAAQIRYTGLRHFSESTLHALAYTSADAEYALSELPQIMQRVLDIYQQRGYLFAKVELDSLVQADGLSAYIKVGEGKLFEPVKYHFKGNKLSREATILKNSGYCIWDEFTSRVGPRQLPENHYCMMPRI